MAKTGLKRVSDMALEDRAFFEALIRDPDRTLEKAGMKLSGRDLRSLKQIIKKRQRTYKVDVIELFRMAHVHPPIAAWRFGWPVTSPRPRGSRAK